MAYCGPKGIPLHEFLTWPAESQQAALAWQAHEGRRHAACGTHPEDFPDGGRGPAQVHWHERVCIGCQRLEASRAQMRSDADGTAGVRLIAASGPASTCPSCSPTT
jgi:hypothetical protein